MMTLYEHQNGRMELKKILHVVVIIWLSNEAQVVYSSICVADPVYSNCSCTIANRTVIADCSHLELKESPKFTSIVQIVNLSFNEMEQTPVPGSLPAGLQVLDLSSNKIKIFLKSTFNGLYSLQILNISSNFLTLDDITFYKGVFGDLKALWHLKMQNNSCNSSNPKAVYPGTALQDLISLRVLEIDGLPTYNFGQEFSKLRNLSELNLSRGYCNLSLYGLTETYFQYLQDLKVLVVRNCSIASIHNNTFLLLRSLNYLDISDNNLLTFCGFKNASDALIGSLIKIFKANRIYCAIGRSTFVIGKFFQSLRKTTLEELYLDDNKIDYAEAQIAAELPVTLRKLSLSGNKLSLGRYIFINVSHLTGLKELDISYQNKHLKAPYVGQYACHDYQVSINCDCANVGDYLTYSNPEMNGLSQSGQRQSRTSLHVEDKSCDQPVEMITILPPNLTSINFEYSKVGDTIPFMHLMYDHLYKLNLRGNRFTRWVGPVCNATSMQYLDLSENLCSEVSKSFFKELSGLETLILDKNYLVYPLRNDQNGDIFRRLRNLQNISIANNQLDHLPRKIFHGLVNLKALNLSTNAINVVDFDIQHMYNLSVLDLSNNFIRFFDENFTSQIDLIPSNSLVISLENNPLECSCRSFSFLKWFQKKKNSHSVTFVNNQLYNCSDDNGYPLNSGFAQIDVIIHNLEEKCRKTEWYVLVIIIILTTFVLLLLCIFIIYRHKWKIRYFVYLAKREMFKKGYERLGDDNNFKYDVFVSYAEGNRSFATKEVVKRLEGEAGLKVCLHDRDFVPGSDISDNIIGAIRHSRKIIFIVSSHFIKSDWCMYEFHMARYEETVVRKRNCTIFVFLGDIPLADLPYKIAQVRDQTVFADFPRDAKEETNFWNVLIDAVHEP